MQQAGFKPLRPRVILGIAAHPDDLDFGAAGSVAHYAKTGAEVHYLILTDGSKGTADLKMSSPELIKLRQEEQRSALKLLGSRADRAHFLGYPDGELQVTLELKRAIVKLIRVIRPDTVITLDPSVIYNAARGFINHPDHRAAGQAALDAVFPLARDHLTFPELYAEGFMPHKVQHVLLTGFGFPGNFNVDITSTFALKLRALKAHPSQIADYELIASWMRSIAEEAGQRAGCELAESFTRIDVR